jgi:hypothetical protein
LFLLLRGTRSILSIPVRITVASIFYPCTGHRRTTVFALL